MNRSTNLLRSRKQSKTNDNYAKGAYLLLLWMASTKRVNVGKLGIITFTQGFYAYVGSAMGTIGFKRVDRHVDVSAGRRRTLKWHVDYLLANSEVIQRVEILTKERIECQIANNLAKNPRMVAIRGFGSSDCRCASHLFFSRNLSDHEQARNELVCQLCLKKEGVSALGEAREESRGTREALVNIIRYTL